MALVEFVRHSVWWQTDRVRIRIGRDINGLHCTLVGDMPSLWHQRSPLLDIAALNVMELALDVRCLDRIWVENIPKCRIPRIWSKEKILSMY